MAQALLWPLLDEGVVAATDVTAVVGHAASAQRLQPACPAGLTLRPATDPAASAVWGAGIQLLAIKPHQLDAVAATVPSVASEASPLLIFCARGNEPGIALQSAFPGRRCVRAPSQPPCIVLAGLIGLGLGGEV
jgi:Pyrroline-5-carboxylate reductase